MPISYGFPEGGFAVGHDPLTGRGMRRGTAMGQSHLNTRRKQQFRPAAQAMGEFGLLGIPPYGPSQAGVAATPFGMQAGFRGSREPTRPMRPYVPQSELEAIQYAAESIHGTQHDLLQQQYGPLTAGADLGFLGMSPFGAQFTDPNGMGKVITRGGRTPLQEFQYRAALGAMSPAQQSQHQQDRAAAGLGPPATPGVRTPLQQAEFEGALSGMSPEQRAQFGQDQSAVRGMGGPTTLPWRPGTPGPGTGPVPLPASGVTPPAQQPVQQLGAGVPAGLSPSEAERWQRGQQEINRVRDIINQMNSRPMPARELPGPTGIAYPEGVTGATIDQRVRGGFEDRYLPGTPGRASPLDPSVAESINRGRSWIGPHQFDIASPDAGIQAGDLVTAQNNARMREAARQSGLATYAHQDPGTLQFAERTMPETRYKASTPIQMALERGVIDQDMANELRVRGRAGDAIARQALAPARQAARDQRQAELDRRRQIRIGRGMAEGDARQLRMEARRMGVTPMQLQMARQQQQMQAADMALKALKAQQGQAMSMEDQFLIGVLGALAEGGALGPLAMENSPLAGIFARVNDRVQPAPQAMPAPTLDIRARMEQEAQAAQATNQLRKDVRRRQLSNPGSLHGYGSPIGGVY